MANPTGDRGRVGQIVGLILAIVAALYLFSAPDTARRIDYSEFRQLLAQGKVQNVVVGATQLTGTLKETVANQPKGFRTERVDSQIADELTRAGVPFAGEPEPGLIASFLRWLMPTLGLVLLWLFLAPRLMGGAPGQMLAIGKSKARVYVESDTRVTFADIAGVDEAKAELQEIVRFLKDPQAYGRLGARLPRGILLVGPPGTGKTLLARAVAGEAGVPFFSITGSEFVEMFVGVGAARVRDLFEQARKTAPAIVFIDELDALGRARGLYPGGGGHDEKEQTLNQLLAEMDGFDPRQGLVLLAATNRPEILDPALLRAGRFDRQVLVDRPDRQGRVQILKVHVRKVLLAADVDLDAIAALTTGFSGADLANLVNEAALLATRRNADSITGTDFTQAIERIVAGLEKKSRILNPRERRTVAYHELGHAFVALSIQGSDTVHKVSIIPRGVGALGYTIQRPTEDRYLMSRSELECKMAVLLGGRAAEQLVFSEVSTGAADDLAKATDIARSMVLRYGMVPGLGQVAYEEEPPHFLNGPVALPVARHYSEDTSRRIDQAIRELVDQAFAQALTILQRRRPQLDAAAEVLLQKETLLEADLRAFLPAVASPAKDGGDGDGGPGPCGGVSVEKVKAGA